MTTVKQAKETIIYVIDRETGFPIETTLYDWVTNFEDENKLSVEYVQDQYVNDDGEFEDGGKYFLRYRRVNRPSQLLSESFDTEEEAEDEIFDRIYRYDFEKAGAWENTEFFESEDDCEANIISRIADDYSIHVPVAESVYKRMKLLSEKRAIRQADNVAKYEADRAKREALIPVEVATITIDQQFKSALLFASEATGKEKSDRMASAMKGLMQRNNIEKINSDFWKVFRILKAKSDKIQLYTIYINGVAYTQGIDEDTQDEIFRSKKM